MEQRIARLHLGQPDWLDQIVFRTSGVAALCGFWRVACWLFALTPAAAHQGWVIAVAVAGVVCLCAGLALCLAGPWLLVRVPSPKPRFKSTQRAV